MLFWFPKDGERVKQHGKLNIGGVKGSGGHGGGQGSSSQVPRERCMLVLLLWQARTGGGGGGRCSSAEQGNIALQRYANNVW